MMIVKHRNLMRKYWLAIALLTMASVVSAADVPAGLVKKVSGTVRIERGGTAVPVQVGTFVMNGDRIVTDADSSVGLTLQDDTLLSAGPSSVISLNHFAFNSTTNDGGMSLQILKGTLRAITGLIARNSPAAVEVKTPTTTIGIRGTDFIVEVPEND